MPSSLSYDHKCKGEILGLEKHISQSDMMQFPGILRTGEAVQGTHKKGPSLKISTEIYKSVY